MPSLPFWKIRISHIIGRRSPLKKNTAKKCANSSKPEFRRFHSYFLLIIRQNECVPQICVRKNYNISVTKKEIKTNWAPCIPRNSWRIFLRKSANFFFHALGGWKKTFPQGFTPAFFHQQISQLAFHSEIN